MSADFYLSKYTYGFRWREALAAANGTAGAGMLVALGPDGLIDPSFLPEVEPPDPGEIADPENVFENVRDYGATGLGIADDRSAIQAAINASVISGLPVYFPKGVYRINNALTCTGSMTFLGAGEQSAIILQTTNVNGLTATVAPSDQILIRDVCFRSGATLALTAIEINGTDVPSINYRNCLIENVRIDCVSGKMWTTGIKATHVWKSKFKNLIILGGDVVARWMPVAMTIIGKSVENEIDGFVCAGALVGIELTPLTGQGIEGIHIKNASMVAVVKGIYCPNVIAQPVPDVAIQNCYLACSDGCIILKHLGALRISDNYCNIGDQAGVPVPANGAAISLDTVGGAVIVGNLLSGEGTGAASGSVIGAWLYGCAYFLVNDNMNSTLYTGVYISSNNNIGEVNGGINYNVTNPIVNLANLVSNRFTNSIGVQLTTRMVIDAGFAAVGGAPLKLTSGVNLTVPENGAFEYDGANLYFTVGGVRKTVTLV